MGDSVKSLPRGFFLLTKLPERQLGFLKEAAGVEVEEYYALDQPVPLQGNLLPEAASELWTERLRILPGCEVQTLASFGPSNG